MSTQILATATEAAHALRMLPARLKRLAKEGRCPVVLLPDGEPRFDLTDLRDWVKTYKVDGTEVQHGRN